MSWDSTLKSEDTKHKVFISYYHKDDEDYRDKFEELFGHLFINKSVHPGDIDDDDSDEYIKQLIREKYITDASVTIILVGPKTYCRKHVDWEIYATLDKKADGYSGLLGLCLPTHPNYKEDNYTSSIIPSRLVYNLKSKYAGLYDWTKNEENIKKWVEKAFNSRIDDKDKIINSLKQFKDDRCD